MGQSSKRNKSDHRRERKSSSVRHSKPSKRSRSRDRSRHKKKQKPHRKRSTSSGCSSCSQCTSRCRSVSSFGSDKNSDSRTKNKDRSRRDERRRSRSVSLKRPKPGVAHTFSNSSRSPRRTKRSPCRSERGFYDSRSRKRGSTPPKKKPMAPELASSPLLISPTIKKPQKGADSIKIVMKNSALDKNSTVSQNKTPQKIEFKKESHSQPSFPKSRPNLPSQPPPPPPGIPPVSDAPPPPPILFAVPHASSRNHAKSKTYDEGFLHPPGFSASATSPKNHRNSATSSILSEVHNCVSDLYEVICQIGEGTYGKVYKGRCRKTGSYVALKRVRTENQREGFPITAIREIRILRQLNHPNIISLKAILSDQTDVSEFLRQEGFFYLVFDYMDHDLMGILESGSVSFTSEDIQSIFSQLIHALEHCHSRNFLHRDIKCSNILLSNDGTVKLADLGLARLYESDNEGRPYTNCVITLWYRPPELLLGEERYGPAVDIWSCGCILAELFTGRTLFHENHPLMQLEAISRLCGTPSPEVWPEVKLLPNFSCYRPKKIYKRCLKEELSQKVSPVALDLIDKMLTLNPNNRLSASAVLSHPFLCNYNQATAKPLKLPTWQDFHELLFKQKRHKDIKPPTNSNHDSVNEPRSDSSAPPSTGNKAVFSSRNVKLSDDARSEVRHVNMEITNVLDHEINSRSFVSQSNLYNNPLPVFPLQTGLMNPMFSSSGIPNIYGPPPPVLDSSLTLQNVPPLSHLTVPLISPFPPPVPPAIIPPMKTQPSFPHFPYPPVVHGNNPPQHPLVVPDLSQISSNIPSNNNNTSDAHVNLGSGWNQIN